MSEFIPTVCAGCGQTIEDLTIFGRIMFLYFIKKEVAVSIVADNAVNFLNKYIENNGIHLSATQLMLFRPDIVLAAFKEISGVDYELYEFQEKPLCESCTNSYKEVYPLR